MRYRYCTILVLTAIFCSFLWTCSSNEPDEPETGLEGTWAWLSTSGGEPGYVYLQDSFPNKYSLSLKACNYILYKDKKIVQKGTYTLSYQGKYPNGDTIWHMQSIMNYRDTTVKMPSIVTGGTIPYLVEYNDTSLFIIPTYDDGFESEYRRK